MLSKVLTQLVTPNMSIPTSNASGSNANAGTVYPVQRFEILPAAHYVLQIFLTMMPVIKMEKGLAIA